MKQICNIMSEKVMSFIDSTLYIEEDALLDLTYSWFIKDIEMKYKTYPETIPKLLVCDIMDLQAEDPRGKNNPSKVPAYSSAVRKEMISLGVHTIKDMLQKDVSNTSGEISKPHLSQGTKKKKGRKCCRAQSKATVDKEKSKSSDDEHPPKSHNGQ